MSLSPGGYTKNFRKRKQDCRSHELEHKKTVPYNVEMKDCKIVVFDIETTGLAKTDEIVQIAAACGDKSFDTYIVPKKNMSEAASGVTGIQIVKNEMLVNKKAVITVTPREGFISFLHFLKFMEKPCILVAHNGNSFDIPRILELAKSVNLMKEFMMFVKGACDSLHLFKCILIDRKKEKLSFKQSDLAIKYLDKHDVKNAHNALNDVLVSQKLLNKICKDKTILVENTKSIEFILSSKARLQKTKECKQSLLNLKLSNQMKGKIAKAGINKAILQEAFKTGGLAGLTILLGENVNNKPRVTTNKKIIKSIHDYLAEPNETSKLPVTS
ncbi:maternal protein exuperantia-1 [Belonocnema kinseyi]|uniref:maternal protein exuperantia-1 n=1 Tax=Belonocnema kinseyi TaxID=2817044 RepID=UPI00143D04DC|nr:maternal protein exuperantia-1 [Belonocnema kinseyi]